MPEINMNRIHELAERLGEAEIKGGREVMSEYANDPTISAEELACTLIYSGCQSVDAAIRTSEKMGGNAAQLRALAHQWIETGFEEPN